MDTTTYRPNPTGKPSPLHRRPTSRRLVTIFRGPSNSGKTHLALSMAEAGVGRICVFDTEDKTRNVLGVNERFDAITSDPDTLLDLAGLGDRLLELGIFHFLGPRDDLVLAEDADLARLGIDLDHDVLGRLGIAPVGRFNRLLERLEEDLLGNALLGVELQQGANEVAVHAGTSLPDQ
jgi:hypothetical protein